MDDVQFSASLDALLNGDGGASGSMGGGQSCTQSTNNADNSYLAQQQQPQALNNSTQPYVVSAGGTAVAYAPQQQVQHHHQGQQQPQHAMQQLAGLPLASANQGSLQLVPTGPHSTAQMSLSAGHAAATGAFHPGNPTPTATPAAASLPPVPQQQHQQMVQSPFPWAIASNAAAGTSAPVAAPAHSSAMVIQQNTNTGKRKATSNIIQPQQQQVHQGNHMLDVSAVSEDEGDRNKRRTDRNVREQHRSHKITEQIAELKEVLSSANQQFKPDKYSTLTKVVEYIKQLQERSQMLDVEHKKLVETISQTNEMVNNQYVPAYTSGSDAPSISNDLLADGSSSSLGEESMVYVRGLDYKIAFQGCGIPLALSSIDGRFLDCNDTFLELTGYSREELLPLEEGGGDAGPSNSNGGLGNKNNTVSFSPDQDSSKNLSLFNLLCRDGMEQVFFAMSEMLKHPGSIGTPAAKPTEASKLADFWSGPVKLCRQDNRAVKLNVTLVRTSRGRPKFFNCALTACGTEDGYKFDDQTTLTSPSLSTSNSSSDQQESPPPPQGQQAPLPSSMEKVLSNGPSMHSTANTTGG